jgi:phosphatidylethanolamine/phosphatidyl-N-methylethanolamine N-methyltransferase
MRFSNLREKIIFLKRYFKNPRSVGSVTPSSQQLAKKISVIIGQLEKVDILEFGPGTGSITHQIKDKNPTLIELDLDLFGILQKKFPELKIKNSCALRELNELKNEVGILMSIPLTNNPIRNKLIDEVNQKYLEKKIKWCITYTYSFSNPLPNAFFKNQKMAAICFLNFPPASIWIYS